MQEDLSTKVNAMEHPVIAGCPADELLKLLAREWTSHIVWTLAREQTMRFGALRRAMPGAVSARVLSARLKELESYGLVSRHDAGTLPLRVEYRLTANGHRLDAALRHSEALTGDLKKSNGNEGPDGGSATNGPSARGRTALRDRPA